LESIIGLNNLTIFLNALYMLRDPKENFIFISIKPFFFSRNEPFLDVKLYQEAQITLKTTNTAYKTIIEDIRHKLPENLKIEIPGADYLREALLMSHILKPKNWDSLMDLIDKGTKRNPLRGEKSISLAFDTNVFRRRYSYFICKYLRTLRGTPIGVIIPEGVREEIFSEIIVSKYNKVSCYELNKAFGGDFFSKICFNQPVLEARLWRNASVELRATEKLTFARTIPCPRGDDNIVKALRRETSTDVILVTEDDLMVNAARLNKVQSIRLDPPPINEIWNLSGSYSWDLLNELIYSLSIVYSAIKVMYNSRIVAYIFGIWAGKKEENWDSRELKIDIKDNTLKKNFDLLNIVL